MGHSWINKKYSSLFPSLPLKTLLNSFFFFSPATLPFKLKYIQVFLLVREKLSSVYPSGYHLVTFPFKYKFIFLSQYFYFLTIYFPLTKSNQVPSLFFLDFPGEDSQLLDFLITRASERFSVMSFPLKMAAQHAGEKADGTVRMPGFIIPALSSTNGCFG